MLALVFDFLDLGAGEAVDALLLEGLLELFGNVVVFNGHEAIHQLKDRDLGAKRPEVIAELNTNGAGTDHDHALGLFSQHHGFVVADHALAVPGHVVEAARPCTGGNDDVLGVDGFDDFAGFVGAVGFVGGVVGLSDFDDAGFDQAAAAVEGRNLVLLEQELDALVE